MPRLSGATHAPGRLSTSPFDRIRPPATSSKPAMQRSAVVLPHPLGPSRQPMDPAGSRNDSPESTLLSPYAWEMFSTISHMTDQATARTRFRPSDFAR